MTKAPTSAASGIENAKTEIIAAGQRHDGQHAGGGIGQHMHIGGAHIVVMAAMGMPVMIVAMIVLVRVL